jgi:hypothetical protein
MSRYVRERNFLKSNFNEFKNIKTDKMKGIPQPEAIKPFASNSITIDLPEVSDDVLKNKNI